MYIVTIEDLQKIDLDPHTARAMLEWDLRKEEVTPEIRSRAKQMNFLLMYGVKGKLVDFYRKG